MINDNKSRKIMLFLVDIVLLYLAIFVSLTLRDFSLPTLRMWDLHLFPFTIINGIWLLIFYIAGFYDIDKKPVFYLSEVFKAVVVGAIVAVFLFYLIPSWGITPKINLFINVLVISGLVWSWRNIFISILNKADKVKIFFWGNSVEKTDLPKILLKYDMVDSAEEAKIVVVSEKIKQDPEIVESLYKMLHAQKTIIDFNKFYESLTGKILVSSINKAWFLENLVEINKQTFKKFKRTLDLIFSLILFIPFLLIYLPVALLIKLDSAGPVLFRQKRVGLNGENFELVKFRSMVHNSEPRGGGWSKPNETDERITVIGNILRKTRIDELPQLWNVLKGDISFVGPRPERPEFVKELIKKIPYYSIRQIVKPGLTGWAQINFSDASAKDALEKMQYDLYYIKNRSFIMDVIIILKTIMVLMQTSGK